MSESSIKHTCSFVSTGGICCAEPVKAIDSSSTDNPLCFWHNPDIDKSGHHLSADLEHFVHSGGVTQGLQLKRADLSNVNLVNHNCKQGYDFSGSDLYRADLSNSHLFNIKLSNGSLMKANLFDANIHCANLTDTNLLGIKLRSTKIDNVVLGKKLRQERLGKQYLKTNKIDLAYDNYQQAEEVYREFRKGAEKQGLFKLAGYCIQKELTMRRMQMPKYSGQRIFSKLVDLFCGYGEKPINVVFFSLLLIFMCAIGYYTLGINFSGDVIQFNPSASFSSNFIDFFGCMYFSVVTFTTLGYGDITPLGFSRLIAACEAFMGSFTIALFVVVFVKKMTR